MKRIKALPNRRILALAVAGIVVVATPAYIAYAVAPDEIAPDVKSTCWVEKSHTGPSTYPEVIVGSMRGMLTGVQAYADPYFISSVCTYGDHGGWNVAGGSSFVLRVESAIAIDDAPSNDGTVTFTFTVTEHSSSCTGPAGPPSSLSQPVSFTGSPYDWHEVSPFPTSGPDQFAFLRTAPAAGTSTWYVYTLQTTTTVTGGSSKTTSDTGCFYVNAI
jgi:hypothetical protein